MLKPRTLAIATLLSLALVGGTQLSSDASTGSVSIRKISGKTVKAGKKATIKPSVRASGQVKISRTRISVKKGRKTVVKNKTSARLKPGKYRVTTKVNYKTYSNVAKTRYVNTLAFYAGSQVPSHCTVNGVPSFTDEDATLNLYCAAVSGARPVFNNQIYATYNHDASWTAYLTGGQTAILSGTAATDLMYATTTGSVVTPANLYRLVPTRYTVRTYSRTHTKSKTQSLRIKTKAKVKVKAKHACTRTGSGTCIQGGQFCPQAKYGQNGWDANGRRYVCEGNHTHPHWFKP